jgi:hypothetical protein
VADIKSECLADLLRNTQIGLDVHKKTIAVALAEAGKRSEVREYGKVATRRLL